jgi:hypothetical protein
MSRTTQLRGLEHLLRGTRDTVACFLMRVYFFFRFAEAAPPEVAVAAAMPRILRVPHECLLPATPETITVSTCNIISTLFLRRPTKSEFRKSRLLFQPQFHLFQPLSALSLPETPFLSVL